MRSPGAAPRRDAGSGTVAVVALVAVVAILAGLLAVLATGQLVRARAQAAADLAALAAAQRVAVPGGLVLDAAAVADADPCGVAGEAAERNGARLTRCEVGATGAGEVEVEVAVDHATGTRLATARAGPRTR